MKTKNLLLTVALIGAIDLNVDAQTQPPNSGFENWTNNVINEPVGFITSNGRASTPGGNVRKVTDSYHGLSAVKLETVLSGSDTVPGMLLIGTPGNHSINGGLPFTGTPDSVSGYVKYNTKPNDTAFFIVAFKKNGITLGQSAVATFTGIQTTYTRFSIPTYLNPLNPPDTMVAIITSSNMDPPQMVGSTLTIDNISFLNSTEQFPNADLENWITINPGENPESWSSYNNFYNYGVPEMSFKTTDAHSGTYALRIISDTVTLAPPFGTNTLDTMAGFVFAGGTDMDNPGIPYTNLPLLMQAYVKGTIIAGSQAYIMATLSKWNTITHVRDQVGFAMYYTSSSITNYTQISVPFNYSLSVIPDTLDIRIMAGDVGPGGYIMRGNEFFIDDISFTFSSGINVSGFISSNTNWTLANSPYIITGNTVLDSGITLTIDPGVTVKFDSATSLQINGNLRAIGNSSNRITFTSNKATPAPGDWAYLLFADKSQDYNHTLFTGNIMDYCVVKYAGHNSVYLAGAIRISSSFPYIRHCEVSNNSTTGVIFYNDPNGFPTTDVIKISNCNIHDNSTITNLNGKAGGIDITINQAQAIVDSCTISHNSGGSGGGIKCYANNHTSKITNNFIIGNFAKSGGGIHSDVSVGEVSYNLIYGNTATDHGGIQLVSVYPNNINNNMFVNNTSFNGDVLYVGNTLAMTQNTIVDNAGATSIINNIGIPTSSIINNTITRNQLSGSSSKGAVYIHYPTVFKNNNIYLNAANYEVYTDVLQSTPSINLENCWWNTTTASDIDKMIYDFLDNSSLSIVDYNPIATSPDTIAPVSPPMNVIKTDLGGGKIKLTWNANQERDLAGYKIYWGSPTGYSFYHFINVGIVNTYTLSSASITDTIAVTAYDDKIDGVKDQFDGHESWFTNAVGKPIPNFLATPIPACAGDTVFFTNNTPKPDSYSNTAWSWSFSGGMPTISTAKNPKVIYNASGSYSVKLKVTNIAGRDSLILSNYVVIDTLPNPIITASGPSTFCQGNSVTLNAEGGYSAYLWLGNETTQSIVVNQTGTKNVRVSNNCGNTSTGVFVKVNPAYTTNASAIICSNESILLGGAYQTTAGIYKDTLQSLFGCDSIITTTLSVNSVNTTFTISGLTITAGATGATYQWLNCNNANVSITGARAQSFTPIVNGLYAVIVTKDNCSDTSACANITTVGIADIGSPGGLSIYPNPNSGIFTIELSDKATVMVYNILGDVVFNEQLRSGKQEISLSNLPDGIFTLNIIQNNQQEHIRIVKQK